MAVLELAVDRAAVVEAYVRNRERSRAIFDLIDHAAYYARPIALRNPIVFYEGHLPAFSVNTLVKRGLGRPGVDARLEQLFARGIDPDSEAAARAGSGASTAGRRATRCRPSRAEADRARARRLAHARPRSPTATRCCTAPQAAVHRRSSTRPCTRRRCSTCGIGCRTTQKRRRRPATRPVAADRRRSRGASASRPGTATLGADRERPFGWDNEFARHASCTCPRSRSTRHDVTNARLPGVRRGRRLPRRGAAGRRDGLGSGCSARAPRAPALLGRCSAAPGSWRGHVRGLLPLPLAWPVVCQPRRGVARTRDGRARRLPTEAEFQRAAYGDAVGRRAGVTRGATTPPDATRGIFDFDGWDPVARRHRTRRRQRLGRRTIWSATAGSGRPRSSRPSTGFAPMAVLSRSIPRTSSTASTT